MLLRVFQLDQELRAQVFEYVMGGTMYDVIGHSVGSVQSSSTSMHVLVYPLYLDCFVETSHLYSCTRSTYAYLDYNSLER